jgi:vacuolar-type H+-ATPase subunit H
MVSDRRRSVQRLIVFGGVIALLVSASLAGDRNPGGRRVYSILDRFKQALTHVTLTDEQKPQVDDIIQKATTRADDIAQHIADPGRAEKQQALADYQRQLRQELSQVLDAGQMETLRLYLGPGAASRPTADDFAGPVMWRNLPKALATLDLSTDVRQKTDEIVRDARQKAAALRAQTANGANVQSQMAELRQSVKSQLQAVLTPDQMQTLLQTMAQLRLDQTGPATRQ